MPVCPRHSIKNHRAIKIMEKKMICAPECEENKISIARVYLLLRSRNLKPSTKPKWSISTLQQKVKWKMDTNKVITCYLHENCIESVGE